MTSKILHLLILLTVVHLWADTSTPQQYAEELLAITWEKQASKINCVDSTDSLHLFDVLQDSEKVGTIAISTVLGKTDPITFGMALDKSGKTVGFKVFKTQSSHDARLLSRFWQKQFIKKEIHDIDAVSGASISSNNVVKNVEKIKENTKQ